MEPDDSGLLGNDAQEDAAENSAESVQRLRGKLKNMFRARRGQSLSKLIATLASVLTGWMNYF